MATLHVRNVPEELYERLRQEAAESQSSINAKAIEAIRRQLSDRSPKRPLRELIAEARQARALQPEPPLGSPSVIDDIREDRESR